MKFPHLLLLLFACLLIVLVAKPLPVAKQAQEAPPEMEEVAKDTYRVHFTPASEKQNDVADILWFQRAAENALELGVPGFNVIEQQIHEDGVDGVIQLESDMMKAEYDANEILGLHLEGD